VTSGFVHANLALLLFKQHYVLGLRVRAWAANGHVALRAGTRCAFSSAAVVTWVIHRKDRGYASAPMFLSAIIPSRIEARAIARTYSASPSRDF
jgi:hypothetical protein